MARGPLIILSGPSGSGKSTVIDRVVRECGRPLRHAVSATTRQPRPHEQGGVHYHFWDRDRFEREVAAGAFLEWAEVYGNYYGTLRSEVGPYRDKGVGVIVDIDVEGAAQIRRAVPDHVSVFIRTSSLEAYEARLRLRGTEDEAAIQRRLAAARRELGRRGEYEYQVINDDLDAAVAEMVAVVRRSFGGGGDVG